MRTHVSSFAIASAVLLAAFCPRAAAEVNRIVIIKLDGVPEGLIERYAAQQNTGMRQGHSRLPWIEHIFAKNGTWMENFYTRGLSLSSPSWSMLDTGRHLEIRGNADYDRYTLRVFDYMNFFPFYLGYATNHRADMPGVELLDENSVPLLIDRFPRDERYQSFQLYQRGVRWRTLESSLKGKFARAPRQLFAEWLTGFSMTTSVGEQNERELLQALRDPHIHYLDYFAPDYDHVAHLTNDSVVQLHVLESIDALIGRVWSTIEATPLGRTTALLVVSDHGMNTSEGVYSQGYDLINWFNSTAGGAHHVLTNRHPMTEFKLRGLNPFVSEVISPSSEATYLAGESAHYPTVVMDLDGNERASISLRNSALNTTQILLDQLMHKKLQGRVRSAALRALFETLGRVRPEWQRRLDGLSAELAALRPRIDDEQLLVNREFAKPAGGWTQKQRARGLDLESKRHTQRLEAWRTEERIYSAYIAAMRRLLSLNPADFDPGKFNIEDLIPRRSLGERNSIAELRHYVAGPAAGGLVLAADGSLDWNRSFQYVDYLSALSALRVRNNVQKDVAPNPVDFIAIPLKDAVWLWRGPDRQALIQARQNTNGVELRYVPVSNVTEDASGNLHYDPTAWCPGLPLEIFEDPYLEVPSADRESWLNEWHTERDWLRAVHRTKYSNGIIGIREELQIQPVASPYLERKRELRLPGMIVFANDHWNFNVRGFNPGGNHGSFLRVSTHSVLLAAGGEDTGIPRGLRVSTPYDSLSFVPTILKLMGRPEPDLPGPIIEELLPPVQSSAVSYDQGQAGAP